MPGFLAYLFCWGSKQSQISHWMRAATGQTTGQRLKPKYFLFQVPLIFPNVFTFLLCFLLLFILPLPAAGPCYHLSLVLPIPCLYKTVQSGYRRQRTSAHAHAAARLLCFSAWQPTWQEAVFPSICASAEWCVTFRAHRKLLTAQAKCPEKGDVYIEWQNGLGKDLKII